MEAIRLTAPIKIKAAAGKGPRHFSSVAYTGGALSIAGYDLPIVVDLAGLTTRKNVTANLDHEPSKRVGHVERTTNNCQWLLLEGVISAVNAAAREFAASYDRGYP